MVHRNNNTRKIYIKDAKWWHKHRLIKFRGSETPEKNIYILHMNEYIICIASYTQMLYKSSAAYIYYI